MKNIRVFLSENFHFLVVKFSVYLNRHVLVMKMCGRRERCISSKWVIGHNRTVHQSCTHHHISIPSIGIALLMPITYTPLPLYNIIVGVNSIIRVS